MGVSATNSNRRVRTLVWQRSAGDRRRYADQAGMWAERGIRVPSACILYIEIVYIEIVLRNDLLSALTHSRPYDFQQNKTLNALALMGQLRHAPSVPVLLSTQHDMGELP